jgi:hypothetical protein
VGGRKAAACFTHLYWGYFFANRMATCEAMKPAPPVINTFLAL